jgi:lysophospholipase L1-like esterase
VAFGDSITEGTGDDSPIIGYPGRLQGLLRNAGLEDSVRNEGLGGEKTPEGLSRLNSVLDRGGDVLLLMEGSNDISVKISRETTLFNLGKMAERAETKGLEAVHATMIPRTPRSRVDAENLLNQRLVEDLRHLAGLNQRRVVDNFEIFGAQSDWFANLYSQSTTDFVGHPNATGYDLMASTFFDVLTGVDSTPPVTGILSPWNGANNVKPASEINVELWDFGLGIDITTAALIIDGQPVTAEVTGGQRRAQLRYASPQPLRGVVSVGVRVQDLAAPANAVDREVARFVIAGTTFIDGDIDQDGRVDGIDLVLLARGFGSTLGELRYQSDADLDGDGAIDGKDLAILATTFGESL